MKFRRITMVLLCFLLLGKVGIIGAEAAENKGMYSKIVQLDDVQKDTALNSADINGVLRATGSFDWTISPKKAMVGDTKFSLGQNETVTINCTFSPKDTDIDIGLVAPDGYFYYISAKGGNFQETIKVNDSGYYVLAIRNNSGNSVRAMGFVYY